MQNSIDFWAALDALAAQSEIIIDRPKGTAHPRYAHLIYPVHYGYLKNTSSMDGGGIDVWVGSDPAGTICGIICTIDLIKRDSEIKILIGCTEEEKQKVLKLHNETEFMKGLFIPRR
ncbi:MAG: inorganic pyrophosphatase [Christensenellales bacterium]